MLNFQEQIQLVNYYFQLRKYKEPDTKDALKFLVTELGELLNVCTKLEPEWVRNNPLDSEAALSLFKDELGDCLMMLLKVVDTLDGYSVPEEYESFRDDYTTEQAIVSCISLACDGYHLVGSTYTQLDFVVTAIRDLLSVVSSSLGLNVVDCMVAKLHSKAQANQEKLKQTSLENVDALTTLLCLSPLYSSFEALVKKHKIDG